MKKYDILESWSNNDVYDEKTKKEFDDMMAEYDKIIIDAGYTLPEKIFSYIKKLQFTKELKDIKVLDLCCGTGLVGKNLIKSGINHIDGIDFSENIKIAKENGYSEIFQFNLKEKLELVNKKYNIITLIGALTYFNDVEILELFVKLKKYINFDYFIFSHREDLITEEFNKNLNKVFKIEKIYYSVSYLPKNENYENIDVNVYVVKV